MGIKMKFKTVNTFEMSPDMYHGRDCNEVRPRWMVGVEKEGPTEINGSIELNPSMFPPGTRVLIQVPECPECGIDAEFATLGKCECGFDWNEWRDSHYA